MPWESKHSPKLTIRAKYEPYDALRQRFWRQYITQYDADDSGALSYFELTAMLDSLGSTLTKKTIEGYFTSCGKNIDTDELTSEEIVYHLETETKKDRSQKAKVAPNGEALSGSNTPSIAAQPANHGLTYTGPGGHSAPVDPQELAEHLRQSHPRGEEEGTLAKTAGNVRPVHVEKENSSSSIPSVKVERSGNGLPAQMPDMPPSRDGSELASPQSGLSDIEGETPDDRERIINIRTCPLCHRPRLKKRSEQDIVTHLAICASADWSRVDKIVTANYVTSSQAQRKFFTRIVNKVAIGSYSLGANSGNILVQDRRTGQLQEEKMAVSRRWLDG
jgi:phosphatidylserine decarboxylase